MLSRLIAVRITVLGRLVNTANISARCEEPRIVIARQIDNTLDTSIPKILGSSEN
jgi:hypothetical protein